MNHGEESGWQAKARAPLAARTLSSNVLLDLKTFAACDDLWGGPPGPQPTPSSAQLWLRLCCSVGQTLSSANSTGH
jgi:hypothetical protein